MSDTYLKVKVVLLTVLDKKGGARCLEITSLHPAPIGVVDDKTRHGGI